MKAGYSVQHVFRGDYLGDKLRFAEVVNDHEENKVIIVYFRNDIKATHETTAIFRLKTKQPATNEKNAK